MHYPDWQPLGVEGVNRQPVPEDAEPEFPAFGRPLLTQNLLGSEQETVTSRRVQP